MKSHSALYKVTIAPAATININATGSSIFVRLAAQVFRITLNGGQTIDAEEGFDYVGVEREKFTRLELSNPNTAALDVELFVSDGTVRRGPLRFTRDAPTSIGPDSNGFTIAAGSWQYVSAANLGVHRKHVIITNTHATDTIHIHRPAGIGGVAAEKLLAIFPASQVIVATSATIVVKNPGVNSVIIGVLEIVYT